MGDKRKMTFAKVIKILNSLNDDKTIVVKEYLPDEDGCDLDGMYIVDRFSKYDEVWDYMKYFTDPDCKYHFYVMEDDDFCSYEEIKDE